MHRMNFSSSKNNDRPSLRYNWVRDLHSKHISNFMTNFHKNNKKRMLEVLKNRYSKFPVKDSTKEKISNALKKNREINGYSDEQRKINSEAQKLRHKLNPDSEEVKLKRKKSLRKATGKPVYMKSDANTIVMAFDSAADAVDYIGVGKSQCIYTCCKRHSVNPEKQYKSYGYIWCYQ